jgi:putative oxidoreductase
MIVRRLARTLLASIFVAGGAQALVDPGKRPALAARIGLPESEELVRANGAVMLVGGLALATGRFPRLAALALAGSLLPTTLAGHPFWVEEDSATRAAQRTHFLKNLGLLGGLLLAAVDTEGKESLGRRMRRAVKGAARVAG